MRGIEVTESRVGAGTLVLTLAGTLEAPAVATLLDRARLVPPEVDRVVLDIGQVRRMSAAGIRGLLIFQQRLRPLVRLSVTGADAAARRTLHLAGLQDSLDVEG